MAYIWEYPLPPEVRARDRLRTDSANIDAVVCGKYSSRSLSRNQTCLKTGYVLFFSKLSTQ